MPRDNLVANEDAIEELYSDNPDSDSRMDAHKDGTEMQDAVIERDESVPNEQHAMEERQHQGHSRQQFKVYKRRWFGLLQLILLNIVVSWDWLTFAPISSTSADYFDVSEAAINWLSTGFLFAFVLITPLVIWALHLGPKPSIIWSSSLILVGSWIRYAGTRASGGHFGVVIFGQILIGFAQPFVLAAPTRYSDLWFTESGRVSATAVASLANPFGGALGQLINPFWATNAGEVPNVVLYTAIISTVAALPAFFLPAKPPTPASAHHLLPKTSVKESLRLLLRDPSFQIIFIAFGVYVGFFNSITSLLNQILEPYGFTESDAGICGAILIVVGLVAAAITSPILDRTHGYLLAIKLLVPVIAASYLAFTFAPATRTLAAPYVIAAILGASSFSLVPIALEYLVEVTWPASPEVGSTLCWSAGQLLGAIFIVIMDALKDGTPVFVGHGDNKHGTGEGDRPPGNMYRSLVFQAVIACIIVPLPLLLGVKRLGLGAGAQTGRLRLDERVSDGDSDRRLGGSRNGSG